MFCSPIQETIHSHYLHVQGDKPWYNYSKIHLLNPPFGLPKSTVKILKFGTPQTIAIIVVKIEKFAETLH